MKIKEIARLCKKRKRITVYQVGNTQWVSNGAAAYPLYGLPKLGEESLFTMFDIPQESRDSYFYREEQVEQGDTEFPISFEDYFEREEQAEPEELVISYFWEGLKGIRTSSGTVFFDSELLKPFDDDYNFYVRLSPKGVPYIAVKKGMILLGVILIKDVLTPELLKEMNGFCNRCRLAYENLAPKDTGEESQLHFYKDGEGEE